MLPDTKLDAVDSTTTALGSVGSGRESQSSVSHMDYSARPGPIAVRMHHDGDEQTSETSGAGLARRGVSLPVAIPAGRGRNERSSKPISLSPAKSPSTKKCRSPTAPRGSPMDRLAKKLGIKVR